MRSVDHPGTIHPTRIDCAPVSVRAEQVTLEPGQTLLQGLTQAVQQHGATSAVFSFKGGGAFAPLRFVMPALAKSPEHVAFYSEQFESAGAAHVESGSITFGLNDGKPMLHCHAIWIESDGSRRAGHVLPDQSRVERPTMLDAWMVEGAGFETRPDTETNFRLFQISAATASSAGTNGLVVRLRPNQDLCLALEALCAERNIRRAAVRGGVGSLIGAVFDDGRVVEPHITEVFIQRGIIEPGPDGAPLAKVDVGLVAYTGEMAQGRLARGQNAVLITFELVLDVLETRHDSATQAVTHQELAT